MTDREQELHDVLTEVKSWIDNWSPPFTNDNDWAAVEAHIVSVLTVKVIDALEGTPPAEVADISPTYEPISLAREMVKGAPDAVAAVGILITEDGAMWKAACGHKKETVLWALTSSIHDLMEPG